MIENLMREVPDTSLFAIFRHDPVTSYADRKDIMARFIRVRFDGETVQLAGFVQSEDAAKNAAGIAARTARSEKVQTYLQVEASVTNVETYPTHVGEQSEDALTKALVLTSLASPDVKPQFRNAEIQHVTVAHGQVTVYIIADAPPAEFNLSPHVTPIDGVKGLTVHVDKAYQPAPP